MISLFHITLYTALLLVRGTLGFLSVLSLHAIRNSVASRFGRHAASLFTIFTVSQFHIMFYASRTLPNIFALILMNYAFADRIRNAPFSRPYKSIVLMSVACALFRSELCLYIFSSLVVDLMLSNIDIVRAVVYGLIAAVGTALSSILVDSYFWGRLCYPELEVFYFNVVLKKSSAWGTLPFHWYFTNALPRALGANFVAALSSFLVKSEARAYVALMLPSLLFVSIYSILPHKELRFIFYVVPVYNAVAASAVSTTLQHMFQQRPLNIEKEGGIRSNQALPLLELPNLFNMKRLIYALLCIVALFTFFIGTPMSILQTMISSQASFLNYPSAAAMQKMHSLENAMYRGQSLPSSHYSGSQDTNRTLCDDDSTHVAFVHIDAKSAMNGISQFLQVSDNRSCPKWRYSKQEDVNDIDWTQFTHLISERDSVEGFCVIHTESSFAGIDWRHGRILLEAHTYVHRNMNISSSGC